MKERIFKNWNLMRVLYVLIGGYTATAAFMDQEWLIGTVGLIFAGMGVFAMGCAGGNCFSKSCEISDKKESDSDLSTVEYEEIK